ncbi:NAD(P)-dependent oxidoreductase [Chloroflexia bacterium SDU3-3]|nr:NAD(P)-dependent oxidoreductase [Chloroflexia bacterium SDU3-3]
MERIGLIGLGRMGTAMAERLLGAGFTLAVHNRTEAKAADLLAQGAAWAATPAALAERSDLVLTILTDDLAVEQVYNSPTGILQADVGGKLLIEMSTIRTSTTLALHRAATARGAHMIDAPVSGTLQPAREGTLLILAGGEAADVARAQPVLDALGRRTVHLGPAGSGTTMKLALNLPMAIYWAGLAEAMAMGQQLGLDRAQMLDVYLDSTVSLPAMRAKVPLLLGAEQEVAFDVTGVRKDLIAMIASGQDAGVPMPTSAAALAHFAAATAAGYGHDDLATVVEYVLEMVQASAGRRAARETTS